MFLIGITGQAVSGRSTIARMLSHLANIPVIDSEKVAKEVIYDRYTLKDLIEKYGNAIVEGDVIKNVQEIVKRNKDSKALNDILLTAAEEEITRRCGIYEIDEEIYVIIDTPDMFIDAFDNVIDFMVMVDTPRDLRFKRLMEKSLLTTQETAYVIDGGQTVKDLLEKPHDFYIENTASFDELKDKVKVLWEHIKERECDIRREVYNMQ
jgi:dephospho-CoA kinase